MHVFKDISSPSWLTSTTSLGFLMVLGGALLYAHANKDAALLDKLVTMILPAYAGVKGYQMGQNGKKEAINGQAPPVVPGAP